MNKIIASHRNGRTHLIRLLEGLNETSWRDNSGGNWSVQRAAVHIVNAEIFWMSRADGKERQYLPKDCDLSDFLKEMSRVADEFRAEVERETELNYKPPGKERNSMHWAMVRTTQHNIYHCGMISVLRHLINAPRLDGMGTSWSAMVDSVFESHL